MYVWYREKEEVHMERKNDLRYLHELLNKLNLSDVGIIRQLCAILSKYLQKRGRI